LWRIAKIAASVRFSRFSFASTMGTDDVGPCAYHSKNEVTKPCAARPTKASRPEPRRPARLRLLDTARADDLKMSERFRE
jgi:hypothetical protein